MLQETRASQRFRDASRTAAALAIHDVVSTADLLAAGVSEQQIRHLGQAGFLHRKHRGVHAVGRPALTVKGELRAAWLACGPGAAVSYDSALADWQIARWAGRPHVSVLSGRQHPGIVVHRPRSLPPEDVEMRSGYAVTSVARTILDMAPGRPVEVVGKWVHEAGVQGVLDRHAVWRTLERHPRHRGCRLVKAALAHEVVVTRSGLEDAWLAISRRAGMPRVIGNDIVLTEIGEEEVDFHYPSLNLVVEVDSIRYHSSNWRRRRDVEKTKRLRRAGKRVRRVPELEITVAADDLVTKLRTFLANGAPGNPSEATVSWISA